METRLMKNHPRFASQAEGEERRVSGCFLFSPAAHGLASGSQGPQPTSGTQTCILIHSVRRSSLPGSFRVSPPGSCSVQFLYQTGSDEGEYTVDPGGQRGGQKVLVQPLLPCTEFRQAAMLARQQVRQLRLFLIHRTPPSPGIWHQGKDSHKQLEDTHEYHSPSPSDSRHSVIPSRGRTADAPGGYTVCAPHPGTGFPGWVALNSAEGYRHCNLSVSSETRASHPHTNLPKPPPSSRWSQGKPKLSGPPECPPGVTHANKTKLSSIVERCELTF